MKANFITDIDNVRYILKEDEYEIYIVDIYMER